HRARHHFGWNNAFEPALRIAAGETLVFEVVDASGGQLSKTSTTKDVAALDFARVNPVTGPVYVEGAQPGDALVVDIIDFEGDGEVCGTAVESPMVVTLKFTVQKRANLRRPQFTVPSAPTRHVDERGYHITTGIAPDLMQAARDAVRDAIDYLGKEYRLNPDLAYAVCSVAADLRISEVVDVPNWVVSAYLPRAIFA